MRLFPYPQRSAGIRFSTFLLIGALLAVFPSVSAFGMGTKGTPPRKESREVPPSSEGSARSVRDIRKNADALVGKAVTLAGVFRGWSGSCAGSPPVTRSDWMFEDGTGCIYITGVLPPGLNAAVPRRERIVVRGVVKTDAAGEPYLSAQSVDVDLGTPKN